MAGLAAASSLSEAGFDVVLFEAADYLGKERLLIFLSLNSLGQHYHISSLPLSLSLTLSPSLLSSSSLKCIRRSNATNKNKQLLDGSHVLNSLVLIP